jgi:hypothetical protein
MAFKMRGNPIKMGTIKGTAMYNKRVKENKAAAASYNSPIAKKEYAITAYQKGVDQIKEFYKNNPNATREQIRDLIIAHNKSVSNTKFKDGKAKAKISTDYAWSLRPKQEETAETAETAEETTAEVVNPPTMQEMRQYYFNKETVGDLGETNPELTPERRAVVEKAVKSGYYRDLERQLRDKYGSDWRYQPQGIESELDAEGNREENPLSHAYLDDDGQLVDMKSSAQGQFAPEEGMSRSFKIIPKEDPSHDPDRGERIDKWVEEEGEDVLKKL